MEPSFKQKLMDRNEAIQLAQEILASPDYVVLDVETTGIRDIDEIIQIAVVDTSGKILLDSLVQCEKRSIPQSSTALHGITKARLKGKPSFCEILPKLLEITKGKTVISFNAEFDAKMILQSRKLSGCTIDGEIQFQCAMDLYARYRGMWDSVKNDYRWYALEGGNHTAIGDCEATIRLLKKIATTELADLDPYGELGKPSITANYQEQAKRETTALSSVDNRKLGITFVVIFITFVAVCALIAWSLAAGIKIQP